MSDMEHNKGKLIPFDLTEEVAKALVEAKNEDLEYETYLEQVESDYTWYDEGLAYVGNRYYKAEFEIQGGELYGFAEANMNEDGSIDFNTYHYNGGGHWTEVVEGALK
jgi:hypothetical protein